MQVRCDGPCCVTTTRQADDGRLPPGWHTFEIREELVHGEATVIRREFCTPACAVAFVRDLANQHALARDIAKGRAA